MSIQESNIGSGQYKFPLILYFRISNRLNAQAKAYRDEGNIELLHLTLDKFCRLSELICQHQSYSTYSTKEKLHHNKIYHEFVEERESLKADVHDFPSKNSVKSRGIIETRCQSCNIINEGKTSLMSLHSVDSSFGIPRPEYHFQASSSASIKSPHFRVHAVTLSSPSPVLSYVENAPQDTHISRITVADSSHGHSESSNDSLVSKSLQDVHIKKDSSLEILLTSQCYFAYIFFKSGRLMEEFLELARDNTKKDLETCGILGAFLERGTFYVTTLIIPKQESTSSSCQAIREEEIFAIQNERSLFPLGWIHTHPSQSCFMSSVDLHTQFSYQVMLDEAFAIVMAPTDTSRSYGIFRITDPAGMDVLKECQEKGFHSHIEPADGSAIYEDCCNVYINSNLRFEIFDLR